MCSNVAATLNVSCGGRCWLAHSLHCHWSCSFVSADCMHFRLCILLVQLTQCTVVLSLSHTVHFFLWVSSHCCRLSLLPSTFCIRTCSCSIVCISFPVHSSQCSVSTPMHIAWYAHVHTLHCTSSTPCSVPLQTMHSVSCASCHVLIRALCCVTSLGVLRFLLYFMLLVRAVRNATCCMPSTLVCIIFFFCCVLGASLTATRLLRVLFVIVNIPFSAVCFSEAGTYIFAVSFGFFCTSAIVFVLSRGVTCGATVRIIIFVCFCLSRFTSVILRIVFVFLSFCII